MSETITFTCVNCGQTTDCANDVMPTLIGEGFECTFQTACDRRRRRDIILAEMQEMANKPHVHPVDKFTRGAVLLCGIFMGAVSAIGISYLLFGI